MRSGEIGFIEGIKHSMKPTAVPNITKHGEFRLEYSDKKLISTVRFVFDGEQTHDLKALWDTGSSITVIDPGVIDRLLVLPLPDDYGTINSIIGKSDVSIYKADMLSLDGEQFSLSGIDVWSAPTVHKKVHAIIGMDVIGLGCLSVSGGEFVFRI